jgi:hypothetical protein
MSRPSGAEMTRDPETFENTPTHRPRRNNLAEDLLPSIASQTKNISIARR